MIAQEAIKRPSRAQDRPKIAPRVPKTAILGSLGAVLGLSRAQDSPKINPDSHLGLSRGCLGAIKSPRYVQDSTMIAPREPKRAISGSLGAILGLSWALQGRNFREHVFNLKLVSSV